MRKTLPACLQREGYVGEIDSRVLLQVRGEIRSRCFESRGGLRRESQKLQCLRRTCFGTRSFFQNNMYVRSANAEGAHSGAARRTIRLPCVQLGINEERRAGKIDIRIRVGEIQTRR